jgi:hypothetical protein
VPCGMVATVFVSPVRVDTARIASAGNPKA